VLKTPEHLKKSLKSSDPVTNGILGVMGGEGSERHIEDGVAVINHFSGDMLVWGCNAHEFYMECPEIEDIGPYGVCDTPDQFLSRYRDVLQVDERTFFLTFTHVKKCPDNANRGGGWRWHKWGEYIGDGSPKNEYLDDEDGFDDGVYVYHILQTDGPNKNKENFDF